MTQVTERPRTAGPGSGLGGNWRVIVLNDDHNTFDHVAHTLARTIPGVTVDAGYALADRIHSSGQAIVCAARAGLSGQTASLRAVSTSMPPWATRSCQP